jgi:hypothetical protein
MDSDKLKQEFNGDEKRITVSLTIFYPLIDKTSANNIGSNYILSVDRYGAVGAGYFYP